MMITFRGLKRSLRLSASSAVVLAAIATPATAVDFEYSGYLRAHYSMNLSENSTWQDGVTEQKQGGKGQLSMERYSGKIEHSTDFGIFQLGGVLRATEDKQTDYEHDLEKATIK
ncbi:MAG: hypothetical protein DRQ60_06270, partial [Gammaproteobacteria bacterium]